MPQPDTQLTENKLILLFTIQQKQLVSPIELSDFIVFKDYMGYFTMQDLLSDLQDAELVVTSDEGLRLSPMGEEVVRTFRSRIPNSIRDDIIEYARTSEYRRSSMLGIEATIDKRDGKYIVSCIARDYDREIFSLKLSASSEPEAYQIRNNWQQRGMTILRNLISDLHSGV